MKPNSTSTAILVFLFMITIISTATSSPLVPALYVFGDSLLDSGNNNYLLTISKANYLPYGDDFIQGSGRFTNGKTVADFIAEFVGLPYPPPYMKSRLGRVILSGLNYASGSCGLLPQTGLSTGKCLALSEQIDLFQNTIEYQLQTYYSEQLSDYLSKSLFLIASGNNDYIGNYLEDFLVRRRYSPDNFAQLLINQYSQQLQRLYNLGARMIVIFELGPIGCIPYITRKQEHNGKCVEEVNQLISIFNNKLPGMIRNLRLKTKSSNLVLALVNGIGYDAVINPSKYGLKDGSNPCCMAWFNGTSGCIPFTKPCENPNEHYFWDAFHLTQSMYSTVASRCINDSSVCFPTLNNLLQIS